MCQVNTRTEGTVGEAGGGVADEVESTSSVEIAKNRVKGKRKCVGRCGKVQGCQTHG